MNAPKHVADEMAPILEAAEARAQDLPEGEPVDPVEQAREEKEAKFKRRLKRICDVWGVPFKDARQILRGTVDETLAMQTARTWRDLKSPGGLLLLWGPNGTGKTMAASWLVMPGPPGPYPYGPSWPPDRHPRFVTAADLMQVSMYGSDHEMQQLRNCSVLAIDELGSEYDDEKGAFAVKLSSLLSHREKGPGWTVMTTNMRLKSEKKGDVSFTSKYGNRILSRLHGYGSGTRMVDGEDLRRKRHGMERREDQPAGR